MNKSQKELVLMDCRIMLKNLEIYRLICHMKFFKRIYGILEINMA